MEAAEKQQLVQEDSESNLQELVTPIIHPSTSNDVRRSDSPGPSQRVSYIFFLNQRSIS